MASSATEVFVSYKAEDRARLMPLVKALEAEGFAVWWDAHIGGGTDWREEIRQHLDAARCVIVAWSERSVGSEGRFVRDEASTAQQAGSYVPIKIDAVKPPLGFGEVQAIDFVGWKGKRASPCFVALVDAVNAHLTGDAPVVRGVAIVQPKVSRRTVMAGGVGALAIAGVGGWALLNPGAAAASNRIAVMSFSNLSSDPEQAYFSDGIAEELRGVLSRIGMQVIGKASCDAVKNLDIPTAAAKLGVANILTGSVRRSPDTIRVGAQLVNGKDGVEKWAQSYDRAPGDTIKIQSDIAEQVASALRIALGAAKKVALTLGGTANVEAQDLVLQVIGRRDDSEAGMRRAITLLDRAIALDPNYAEAYARKAIVSALVVSYYAHSAAETRAGLAQSAAIARQTIVMAPKLSAGHGALGLIRRNQLNLAGALAESEIACRLPGSISGARLAYANLLSELGRPAEAGRALEETRAADPLNIDVAETKAQIDFNARRYPQAAATAAQVLVDHPQRVHLRSTLARSLSMLGRADDARRQLALLPADDVHRLLDEAVISIHAGDQAAADRSLAAMRSRFGDAALYQYAMIEAQRGNVDVAFAELEHAWDERDPGLPSLLSDPYADPLRKDPRFAAFLAKLNYPILS